MSEVPDPHKRLTFEGNCAHLPPLSFALGGGHFKHCILTNTKNRNRLKDESGIVLFRAGQNLKHLYHARIAIKGKAYAGVNGGTGEVCGGGGKLSDGVGIIDVDSD